MDKSLNILLVDDDEDDRFIFKRVLHEIDEKMICNYASNGEEALKILKDKVPQRFDYIFLDLNMPRMDGRQFLIEIKKMEEFSNIPVIMYSTSKAERDIIETQKLGAYYFMTKPNKFLDLKEAIVMALASVKLISSN